MSNTDTTTTTLLKAEESRAMQEVQAALVIGKQFPRDTDISFSRIMSACKRIRLAESAIYSYPKGGKLVTGPSIRLAEVLAQSWGNISFGLREISQQDGVSIMQAYAWDTETNTKREQIFYVKHERKSGKDTKQLTDSRDVYEMTANQGARRMRACILAVIPGDIVDSAESECRKTLEHGGGVSLVDRLRKMISAFDEFGVTKSMIEVKLGHKIGVTTAPELVNLMAMYKSIKDGMVDPSNVFGVNDDVNDAVQQPKSTKQGKEKPQSNASTKPAETELEAEVNGEQTIINASKIKMLKAKLADVETTEKEFCYAFSIKKITLLPVSDMGKAFKWISER